MRRVVLVGVLCACSRAAADEDPPIPWKPPADAWEELPKTDADALAITERAATPNKMKPALPSELFALRADATRLVAGEAAIAAAYDAWMAADASQPAFLVFGTLHDSRAQIEAAASIVFRMKTPWGFALEQFRARGKWKGAPDAPSADDADLAKLTRDRGPFDDGAFWRVSSRQNELDHAAWKFGYLPTMTNLVYQARGASMPLVGCDMPPELRAGLTPGSAADDALRELHCARSIHSAAIASAPAHGGDAGLSDDDPMPPERYAILVGANHAAPNALPRFLQSKNRPARIAIVRVLGARPRDAEGEESMLASRLVVTDPILVRGKTPESPDMLLLPDDAWGGTIDRASDRGEPPPAAVAGLPKHDVVVSSDEPARFAIGDASITLNTSCADTPSSRAPSSRDTPSSRAQTCARDAKEWLSVRAGHQPFVLVTDARTMVGAIDVPEAGYVEVHVTPRERALRVVVHRP